ncbi:MAG: 16S rRNA (guanine(966)-N(2))-methyltransferase RsmD [Syntrophobacteraceae bacterium]|jgi:16S rRNA (guanine(966)-N(2))-methyltransferase RsmD|nr:16S rRNA (guanine(966)-N(2))-methyltransferase RsmD [Syntrophobacteraceae bacterium]
MRIVAGRFRGLKLDAPKSRRIRPTADRVREALFSIIASRVPASRVLDLFAGTGALGLEALSRGAVEAVFVDQSAEAVRIIRANIQRLGVAEQVEVLQGGVIQVVRRLAERKSRFDLLFMDPPYGRGLIEIVMPHLGALANSNALLIAEHPAKELAPESSVEWRRVDRRFYGDTAISFYSRETSHTHV